MKETNQRIAIAIFALTTIFSIAVNAKNIGSRVVTACFEQVQLINQFGATITLPLAPPATGCAATEAVIIGGSPADSYLWLNNVPSIQRIGGQPSLTTYLCLEFDLDGAAPAIVPYVIPQAGYTAGKYKVLFDASNTPLVRCRN